MTRVVCTLTLFDSEVPVWSKVNISGMHLLDEKWDEGKQIQPQLQEIFAQVKNAAYEIIQRKGATSYAIGLAVAQIAQSILCN